MTLTSGTFFKEVVVLLLLLRQLIIYEVLIRDYDNLKSTLVLHVLFFFLKIYCDMSVCRRYLNQFRSFVVHILLVQLLVTIM